VRILFVCRASSAHAARWIGQLAGAGWDVHVFPVEMGVHADLKDVTLHDVVPLDAPERRRMRVREPEGLAVRGQRWTRRVLGRSERGRDREGDLVRVIERVRPDVVHSLELIKAGHLVQAALRRVRRRRPPWIATSRGSEIYYLARLPEYREVVERVLSACPYLVCGCQRDADLAKRLGFAGEILGLMPGGGGIDVRRALELDPDRPVAGRRTIAVKGRHGWAGRALAALRAVRLCLDVVQGYRLSLFLADAVVDFDARQLREECGIELEVVPPSPRDEILRLFGRSRVALELSMSDGVSNSMLEAMVMGAFPIQSETSGAGELMRDGRHALFVPPEDEASVARALRQALSDDALVDRAAVENELLIHKHFEYVLVRNKVLAMYERIGAGPEPAS
jgi:glycosyltransferase involved in cell wall biosynthesis